jgi:tetratricopeptide (TPR) repeat protein
MSGLRRSLARARDRELGEFLLRSGRIDAARLEAALESGDPRPLLERLGLEPALEDDFIRSRSEPPEVAASRAEGRLAAGHVLVERIGSGGHSEVWKAWDPGAGRWIALKILQGASGRKDLLDRWRREVLAAVRLSHPNIVPVHAVGEHDGRPWISMAYIAGATLEDRPPSPGEAVRLVRTVALAVDHAHRQGVVHRDLKPANLLLDASGNPWVCDFGIAQVFDAPRLTAPGTLLGTAPYMAPERAAGRDSGTAADVYGLGATLYTLVAGRPPYDGDSFLDILRKVETEDPPRLQGLPRDLERVILKAMARDPRDRYATAAALAADLERLEQNRPVEALPLRRRSLRKARIAVALLILAAGAAFLALRPPEVSEASLRLLESARVELDRVHEALYDPSLPEVEYETRLRRARERVEEASAAAPRLALTWHRRGELAEFEGRFDAAREAWEQALARDPRLASTSYRLGRVLLAQAYLRRLNLWSEPDDAVRAEADGLARRAGDRLESARAVGLEDDLQRALAPAFRAWVRGEDALARDLCDRGLAAFAGRRGAEEFLWLKGLASSDPAEARSLFDRALLIRPRYALARFSRGVLVQDRADLDESLRASPGFGEARLYRGSFRALAGDHAGAVADFEALLDDPRLAPGAFTGRGFVRRRTGDPDGALADLGEAIRRRPDSNHLPYVYRAELHLERRDFEAAARDARAAYGIRPWSWSLSLLLQARTGLRDWAGAQADLDALGVPEDDEARRLLRSLRSGS